MKLHYIKSDLEWEGIYIDGILHEESEKLGEGDNFYYLLELAEEKGFKRENVEECSTNEFGELYLEHHNNFPYYLKDFNWNDKQCYE